MTHAKDDRQLDKRPILPSGRHLPTSCYYSSFSCFLLMILPCAFLSREALSQPPSSRSRWIHLLLDFRFAKQAFLSLSARRRGFFSIFSVFCGLKFRALSCLSWLLMNDLVAAKPAPCPIVVLSHFSCPTFSILSYFVHL